MKILVAIFVILSTSLTFADEKLPIHLAIPSDGQTTQIEAGYPMGCQITSLVYALKFGPSSWQKAYQSISGVTDIQKIKSLALKLGGLQSRDVKGQPAFSEKYGVDPNDLPWMFESLVSTENKMSLLTIGWPPGIEIQKPDFLSQILELTMTSLNSGKPILAGLYYSNPDFSHAVLITGILATADENRTLKISVLDPMTGLESEATLTSGIVSLVGHQIEGISFDAPFVVNRAGVLLNLLH